MSDKHSITHIGLIYFHGKSLFRKFEAPLRHPCPGGGGGAYDFTALTENPDPDNAALSRPGRHSGGAKPLERHQEGGFLQSPKIMTHDLPGK
jgi:hypothetical protein